jgi:hypothetical protein
MSGINNPFHKSVAWKQIRSKFNRRVTRASKPEGAAEALEDAASASR